MAVQDQHESLEYDDRVEPGAVGDPGRRLRRQVPTSEIANNRQAQFGSGTVATTEPDSSCAKATFACPPPVTPHAKGEAPTNELVPA